MFLLHTNFHIIPLQAQLFHTTTMVAQRILSVSNIQTAARHWVPIAKQQIIRYPKSQPSQLIKKQFYSSRIRCVNYNNINDISLVSNDDVINASAAAAATTTTKAEDAEPFEPTIYSSEDVHTAGPVNRA